MMSPTHPLHPPASFILYGGRKRSSKEGRLPVTSSVGSAFTSLVPQVSPPAHYQKCTADRDKLDRARVARHRSFSQLLLRRSVQMADDNLRRDPIGYTIIFLKISPSGEQVSPRVVAESSYVCRGGVCRDGRAFRVQVSLVIRERGHRD